MSCGKKLPITFLTLIISTTFYPFISKQNVVENYVLKQLGFLGQLTNSAPWVLHLYSLEALTQNSGTILKNLRIALSEILDVLIYGSWWGSRT